MISRKTAILIFFIMVFNQLITADEIMLKNNSKILLWPGVAPGSPDYDLEEKVNIGTDRYGTKSREISSVLKPSLIVFKPNNPNGAIALILPGGGYRMLTFDKGGIDIAKWLNKSGITAFVLKYRLPGEGHKNAKYVPLQDAQRAIRIIRKNALSWKLDPKKIGVFGASAGGHLAAVLATNYDKKVYEEVDSADTISARPDFLVLSYPAIPSGGAKNDSVRGYTPLIDELYKEFPINLQVTVNTPKAFIVQGYDDDKLMPQPALEFYTALYNARVEAELHFFNKGYHGFSIQNISYLEGSVTLWASLCEKWMENIGVIESKKNKKNGTKKTINFLADGEGFIQYYTNDDSILLLKNPKGIFHIFNTYYNPFLSLEAEVKKNSGGKYGYGILFCFQDYQNYYRLVISANGIYEIFKKVNGANSWYNFDTDSWQENNSFKYPASSNLNIGFGAMNRIKVVSAGKGNFDFYFNGVKSGSFKDNAFTAGYTGFNVYVGSSSEEKFPDEPVDVRCKLISSN